MKPYKEIRLRPGKEASLQRFHPWVFSGAIAHKPEGVIEGETVRVLSADGSFLGVGHFQIGSIAVRIMSFVDEAVDGAFYERRLSNAYKMRSTLNLVRPDNTIFRLVHGEGDYLPGLIVDIYGNTAVVQAHSVGIHKDLELVTNALKGILPADAVKHIFYKSEGTLPYKAGIFLENSYLSGGEDVDGIAMENGLQFRIDWLKGQKTGFFVDQRENRALLEYYARDRHVANMFCYTGGFSVYALRGGAASVVSVDSSAKAVSIADQNVALNFGDDPRHRSCAEDAFKFLKQLPDGEKDLIILDPPAFAKHRGAINNALQGYKKLNLHALEKIAAGGILFTFSCSQVISAEQFRLAVFSAAAISGRKVRILHQLTQPADHPINIYHPEGEYLKGLVLEVE
ncbi:class I SAM-dependent rRNA methyltransferase [Proteiniphilum sp. X52]|uniref:class I SAM-dependent rRNA methyltransferase n=1 Tax=Proteiniphilum sp. X52 TaxID=2382159 RepID=UPI000F0A102B|nr:class I SAM-dependent rRNA methyltransferase [Proteiniphilum sp. X52]RNC66902.1 class I SAM-dependent rRNA methyltransferase [Proteiniphilum sp. X52]